MSTETVFRNAAIVLADEVIHGSVRVTDGIITAIDEGPSAIGEDCDGDWLIPGIVELHTDHLENHYAPRPRVRWNPLASVQAHDAQIAASGITTVFDALRAGSDRGNDLTADDMRHLADAIETGMTEERLRADHFIHLRCEVSAVDTLDAFDLFKDDPRLRLASLMDHTPGQRQFLSIDHHRAYYKNKYGASDAEYDAMLESRQRQSALYAPAHRQAIADHCRARGVVLASHDDATAAHVTESVAYGVSVAEFPTTVEAALASREAGLSVLMGAPNVVRGGSHTGNVSALSLMKTGLLDILSSDYVPFSLIHAAFLAADDQHAITVPQAIATITRNPAAAVHLDDRGEIAIGRRGDLVRVRLDHEVPMVRGVWRQGRRIA